MSLFTPLTIRSLTLRNRLWIAPMCQYSAVDGMPNDWHLAHLGSFATGGTGLVLTEATAIVPEGRITVSDTGLWNDQQRDAWARITRFAHEQGTHIGVQLAHAGRKASTWRPWAAQHGSVALDEGGWQTVAPSPLAFSPLAEPRELSGEEIAGIVRAFADAAVRAIDTGFDVIELHAAHGYLLHQFLSPLSNQREDRYGGSLENRARLLLEVIEATRDAIGDEVPLFVRFSATDYTEGGWDPEQTSTVARWAAEAGADFFDISSGGNVPGAAVPVGPLYQVALAEQVRREAGVLTSAVGLITTAKEAEAIVSEGHADAVMIGRLALREPRFPLAAAAELGVEPEAWPPQFVRARTA